MDVDKPSLEAVYLAHFGVRGMHWGVRRDGSQGSRSGVLRRHARKAAMVATGVAGMVAVHYILGHRGTAKISEVVANQYVMDRQRRAQAKASPFADLAKRFREAHTSVIGSPMEATKGMTEAEVHANLADPNYVWRI